MKKIYYILAIILLAAIVLPTEAATSWSKYKIMLDPGHGGHDSGAGGAGGSPHEATLVLRCGKALRDRIVNECGGTVKMTRSTDVFIELSTRRAMSVSYNPYIFCSIHLNAFNKTAKGTETYYYWTTGNSKVTATKVQNQLLKQFKRVSGFTPTDRGVKQANLAVIRGSSSVPAILTEGLFVDNKTEWNLIKSNSNDGFKKWVQGHLYGFYDRLKQINSNIKNPTIETDTEAPTMKRMTTVAKDDTTFYVYAHATDNVGVVKMNFRVYPYLAHNDSTDTTHSVTKKGSYTVDGKTYTWRYKVNIKDYNKYGQIERGKYYIEGFAWDKLENPNKGASRKGSTTFKFGTSKITPTMPANEPDTIRLTNFLGDTVGDYRDILVTAENLSGEMTVTNDNEGIAASCRAKGNHPWNAQTGGEIRLRLRVKGETVPVPEPQEGTVTISGTAQDGSPIIAEIPYTFTIIDPNAGNDEENNEPETPSASIVINDKVTDLQEVWNFSENSGVTTDWITNGQQVTQDMAFKDGKLYVIHREGTTNNENKIFIINAYTGEKIGELPTTTCTSGTYNLSAIENFDGKIIACNLAATGTETLDVYMWNDDNSEPVKLLSTTDHNTVRAGDAMSVSGDSRDGKIWFGGASPETDKSTGKEADVYYYLVSDGVCATTPKVISLKDAKGQPFENSLAAVNLTFTDDSTFWVDGKDHRVTHFKEDGTYIEEIAEAHALGADLEMFNLGSKHYAAAMTYQNQTATSLSEASFTLLNITDGVSSAVEVGKFPAKGLGFTRNTSFRNSLCYEVNENDLNIWVLSPFQGAAYYKFVHSTTAEDGDDDTPTGVDIEGVNNNEKPVYYNLQGIRISQPTQGLYIRVQGEKVTKVLVL